MSMLAELECLTRVSARGVALTLHFRTLQWPHGNEFTQKMTDSREAELSRTTWDEFAREDAMWYVCANPEKKGS